MQNYELLCILFWEGLGGEDVLPYVHYTRYRLYRLVLTYILDENINFPGN